MWATPQTFDWFRNSVSSGFNGAYPPRAEPAKEAMLPVSPMSITVEPLAPRAV